MGQGMAVKAVLLTLVMSVAGCGAANSPADGGPEGGGEGRQRTGGADAVLDEVVRDTEGRPSPQTRREVPADAPAEEPEAPTGPETARVDDGFGALSLTVPASWTETIRGSESEAGNSWSAFAGEPIASSVTAAPSLSGWSNVSGAPGVYAVVSRTLADGYTDEALVNAGPNQMGACQPGSGYDLSRGPYTGIVQEWQNCGESGTGTLTVVASPEGRECVLLMQFTAPKQGAVVDEAQRDLLLNGFEIDCSRLPRG